MTNDAVASATEQSQVPEGGLTPLIASEIPRRGCLAMSLEKRDAWGKRGSAQFVEGVVFLGCGNEGQHSLFTSVRGPVCW